MKKITDYLVLSTLILGINYAQSQTARVQIIHNCPDLAAAQVDVYINGTLLLDNFAFRTATPFADAPAGTPITVEVKESTSTVASPALYTITPTLVDGSKYILIANGIVSATGYSPNQPFQLSVNAVARETATVNTNTDVLVNHGSPDAPTVDIVETSVPVGTIVNNISYPQFSSYLQLPTANYTLDVTAAPGTPVIASYSAPLTSLGLQGEAITVLASGFLNPANNSNGPAFGLWVALSSGGPLLELPTAPLSVNSFSAKNIGMYPNPASSTLTIDIPFGYNKSNVGIYDLEGREIKFYNNLKNQIDVSTLSNGLYLLNLSIDDVNYVQKFIINK